MVAVGNISMFGRPMCSEHYETCNSGLLLRNVCLMISPKYEQLPDTYTQHIRNIYDTSGRFVCFMDLSHTSIFVGFC